MYRTKTVSLVEIDRPTLTNFVGNGTISTIERLIEEAFKVEPYIHINGDARIWHRSEQSQLLQHIQQL